MKISIFRRKFMPVNTVGSPSVDSRSRITSSVILFMRNRFKMLWVHAKIIFTNMVDFKPFRNRTPKKLVGEPMSVSVFPIESEIAVPSFFSSPTCGTSYPNPTTTFDYRFYFIPESFYFAHTVQAYLVTGVK